MTFRMGKRAAMEMHLGSKEVYQVRQGEALVYAKQLTITQTLDGVTSDAPSSVAWGDGLVVTLTADSGTQMASVVVTMGGVDITSTSYDGEANIISIAVVTGNVNITAASEIVWEQLSLTSKYLYRGTTVGGTAPGESNSYYDAIKVACSPGDKFKITGTVTGSSIRLWMWLGEDEKIISISTTRITLTNQVMIAPENAAYFILNTNNGSSRSCYKQKFN